VAQADRALDEQTLVVRPSVVQYVPHRPKALGVYGCAVKIDDSYDSTHGCKILPVEGFIRSKEMEGRR
jgi:hypothetical protein